MTEAPIFLHTRKRFCFVAQAWEGQKRGLVAVRAGSTPVCLIAKERPIGLVPQGARPVVCFDAEQGRVHFGC